jgi:hypothetical protein
MKRSYSTPSVTHLGSVSRLTEQMTGSFGEFVAPGGIATGMMMDMMA